MIPKDQDRRERPSYGHGTAVPELGKTTTTRFPGRAEPASNPNHLNSKVTVSYLFNRTQPANTSSIPATNHPPRRKIA
jgi:hypothetical protein